MLERHSSSPAIDGRTRRASPLAMAGMIVTVGAVAALSGTLMIGTYQPNRPAASPHEMHAGSPAAEVGSQGASTASDAAADRPMTTVRPISCEALPNVPGKSLTVAIVDYPPDAYTPRHRHPGSVYAFVLKGTLRSQLQGGPAGTYAAGQAWFEPPGALHLFAENASKTEPAELLATFITDSDCGPLVLPE